MKKNAVLVFLHETDEPGEVVFFNDIPVYLAGTPQEKDVEDVIRKAVDEQTIMSGPWFRGFLKVLVVKGTDTCPYKYSEIYGPKL